MSYMDTIKLKSAEDIFKGMLETMPYNSQFPFIKSYIIAAIKLAQKDAIEKTLQIASENADADYNITESFDRITGEDIEVYVINSSITSLKDEIFKLNGL